MAHCHFVSGSPLRTLCLLIAGQPADVFNFENPVNSGSLYSPRQPVEVILYYYAPSCPCMLFWASAWFLALYFDHQFLFDLFFSQKIVKLLYHKTIFCYKSIDTIFIDLLDQFFQNYRSKLERFDQLFAYGVIVIDIVLSTTINVAMENKFVIHDLSD